MNATETTPTLAWRAMAIAVAMSTVWSAAQAQEVFRGQSSSGSVTYSDKASSPNAQRVSVGSAAAPTASLPPALQRTVARYPVKLYGSPDCAPCTLGRNLLAARGIPFQEYTIATTEDQQEASRVGIKTLPHLTIGTQALQGFDSQEWDNYLTAAGYEKASTLPASYRNPAVKSMAIPRPEPAPADNDTAEATTTEPSAPSTGFRF